MGHLVGKDIYKRLGKKIDNLTIRAPWNDSLYEILKELYSSEEAELIIKMPFGLATIERIQKITGLERAKLQQLLEGLAQKGLVTDFQLRGEYYYAPSPMVIGIFSASNIKNTIRAFESAF